MADAGVSAGESVGGAQVEARPRAAAVVEWGLVASSYVVLFFGEHWVGADGGMRFDDLTMLLEKGKLNHDRLSIVGPLFSTPLYYLGKKWLGDARLGCAYYNWLLLGIGAVVLARLLRDHLPAQTIRRFLLVLLAASMCTFHAAPYYGEVFTAVCVGAGVVSVCTRQRAWLGWTAFVLGAVNTPAAGVGAGAACFVFAIYERRLRFILPFVAVGALGALESYLHRGGLNTGYEGNAGLPTVLPYSGRPGFSYPMFLGLLGLLFSFGKGLVYYAPGLLLPVRRALADRPTMARAYVLWIAFLGGLLLVYSKWWGWQGGQFWGPRYVFFAAVPASFALACNLGKPRSVAVGIATLLVLTLSVWIGADGLMFGQQNLGRCGQNNYADEHLCWHVPEFAAWIRPFIEVRALTTKDWLFILNFACVYGVLAAPIVAFLARSLVSSGVPRLRQVFDRKAWSF
jgi:hypothetical protein